MNPEFVTRMRVAVLAIFLAGMPVLALPQVNDWLGQRLFGEAAAVRSTLALSPASDTTPSRSAVSRTASAGSRSAPIAESPVVGSPIAKSPVAEPPKEAPAEAAQVVPAAAVERLPPAEFEVAGAKYGRLQARLRELGADYWRLETKGAGASAFRFECHLPLPGHDSYSRPFAAESTDPLDAMQRVVAQVEKQVEKWQAAETARRAGGSDRR